MVEITVELDYENDIHNALGIEVPRKSAETLCLELVLATMLCVSSGTRDIFPHRYGHVLYRSELPDI